MESNNNNNNKGGLLAILATLTIAGGEKLRRKLRENAQKELQKRVTNSMPAPESKQVEDITFEVVSNDILQSRSIEEIDMEESETSEWKSFLKETVGPALNAGLTGHAFSGLLRSDVPIKDLMRLKDNSSLMRGLVFENNKIKKQAIFQEAGLKQATPLLVYQCLAVVTSQYYQQIISEKLDNISGIVSNVQSLLEQDDESALNTSFKRLKELESKKEFDIADKIEVTRIDNYVRKILDKYRNQLQKIDVKNLSVSGKWSDEKEAHSKVDALERTRYIKCLKITICAEIVSHISTIVALRISQYLGNSEDTSIYLDRLSIGNWQDYRNQFKRIRHDVLMYIKEEKNASYIKTGSIDKLLVEQKQRFDEMGSFLSECQSMFDKKIELILEVDSDGNLKKYVNKPEV